MGKRILVVGEMGYHEHTTILPILNQLKAMGATIDRVGGNMDFFVEENQSEMIQNWTSSLMDINLGDFDIVFFVDFWNMILPLFLYKKGLENFNCQFVGLCHGTVRLPHDVAIEIPYSRPYEEFLKVAYNKILVPYHWLKEMMTEYSAYNLLTPTQGTSYASSFYVSLWPVDSQIVRKRPVIPTTNRVIFSHRFKMDKGNESFIAFVESCRSDRDSYIRDIEFIVTDIVSDSYKDVFGKLNIKDMGRLSQSGLKQVCEKGGYAWSSVNSETFGYAILDLISYGLTPLLNNHLAYSHIPGSYKYTDFSEAKDIIKKNSNLSNEHWEAILLPMKDNANKLAEIILEG